MNMFSQKMSNDQENNCSLVNSRGCMKVCEIYSRTPHSSIQHVYNYDFSSVKKNTVLYVNTSALRDFVLNYLPKLDGTFILVCGDCDETFPTDVFRSTQELYACLENNKIIHMFIQNCIVQHPKISQLPIGLAFHCIDGSPSHLPSPMAPTIHCELFLRIRDMAKPFWEREKKCYGNFQFQTWTKYGYDRKNAYEKVPKDLVYYEPKRTNTITCYKQYSKYAFVLSPFGNGLDCHRTWEALAMGCIPILCHSQLDPLFEDLPVLLLNDWSDLTQELLDKTIEEYKEKLFDLSKLELKYWKDLIYSKKAND